ncbi:Polysaccharide pyruvyl transferase family protein WcaK [Syntrophus gentianae]|uniref:Polysaccharide pyruvyl transferase family protein WcaK n=2 Tax=Syntrophus gentianae TaxID=43775 RepID=A0A1H7X3T7_9BACT|nr:Polysaccharide pyruvyl transferase family protein WcaK [Syntrophus gentianae]
MAHYPDSFRELCQIHAVEDVFQYPFGKGRFVQVVWLCRTLIWMSIIFAQTIFFPQGKILLFKGKVREFLWADVVVSVGAERINDKFIKNICFSLYTYEIVKRLGRPMVLFPCTIGPFLFKSTQWLAATVLRHLDLIYTRDNLSFKTTCGLKGVGKKKVVNTSDVAIFQPQADRNRALNLIGAKDDEYIVGISVMRWSYVANSVDTAYSNYESYVREMAFFADNLVERYGVTVIFYPTNFPVRGCREDDVTTAREIQLRMRYKDRTRIIEKLPRPSDLKGMLACSEINITTRMHACILSTGAYVPTISINYLFKLREYMHSLGLGDFSIDIEQFNADWALKAFNLLWDKRSYWRGKIREGVRIKQEQLSTSMEQFDALLQTRQNIF